MMKRVVVVVVVVVVVYVIKGQTVHYLRWR